MSQLLSQKVSETCKLFLETHIENSLLDQNQLINSYTLELKPRLTLLYYKKFDSLYTHFRDSRDYQNQRICLTCIENVLTNNLDKKSNDSLRIKYLFNYGVFNNGIDALEKANSIFEDLLEILEEKSNSRSRYFYYAIYNLTLHQLAEIEAKKANYHKAIKLLEHSINVERKRVAGTDQKPIIASNLARLGKVYLLMNDYENSAEYYRMGNEGLIEYLTTASKENLEVYRYHYIGYLRGEIEPALKSSRLDQALKLLKLIDKYQLDNHPNNNLTNLLWAEYYSQRANFTLAAKYYQITKKGLLSENSNYQEILNYKLSYSNFLSIHGKLREALVVLDSVFSASNSLHAIDTKTSRNKMRIEIRKIYLLHELGENEKALILLEALTKEINSLLLGTVLFEDHVSFVNDFYPVLELGLEIIHKQKLERAELAFLIIEATKAVSLYKASLLSFSSKNLNHDSLIVEYKTLSALQSQYKLLETNGDSTLDFKNNQFDTNRKLEKVKAKLRERKGTTYGSSEFLSLYEYRSVLEADQVHFLSFAGQKSYFILKIQAQETKLFLHDKSQIDNAVTTLYDNISYPKESQFIDNSKKLYSDLIEISLVKKQHIIFSGDGFLNILPLEVLRDTMNVLNVLKNPISYVQSAQINHFLAKRPASKKKEALIVSPPFSFGRLPFAVKEAKSIRLLLNAQVIEGQNATKQAFTDSSDYFRILHLATHATAKDDPSQSYISFLNSKLHFDEIRALILDAELVTLSACETNVGQNFNGEGVQSLSRNFIAAGAKSVISSMWAVNDQTTSEIIISFYTYLKKGYSKAESLQKAKIDYLENNPGEGQHPYYWAGLVLTGNPDPIFPRPSKAPYYILASVLFVGIAYYGKKKLQKTAA